jgi:hypothetical protein
MESFRPVRYSLEENRFFLKHLGESPVSALREPTPPGVNPVTVQEVLGEVYELAELEKHRGVTWAGVEKVGQVITRYLSEYEKWQEMATRGAPRFPTMHAWDGKGRPHRGGITSDAGEVSTYFDDQGERKPLSISLRDPESVAFRPPWTKVAEPIPDTLTEDLEKGLLQCPVDGWATNFKPESRASYNMARGRMVRHCKTSKDERVREFALKAFS